MRRICFLLCSWVLIAAGSFLTARGAFEYWQSRSAQHEFAREWVESSQVPQSQDPIFSATVRSSSQAVPPRRGSAAAPSRRGDAIAKLTIPRLKTVLYVVEGTDDDDLKRGPGHMTGTTLPGENGNCVIAGHRDTHFRVLRDVEDGDQVLLERGGHEYRYRVKEMSVVSPDDTDSLRPAGKPVLNLITCYPFEYIGSAPKRLVVHADLEAAPVEVSRSLSRPSVRTR